MKFYDYLINSDPAYIDEIYEQYKNNPGSLDASWQKFFEGYELGIRGREKGDVADICDIPVETARKELYVLHLINAYRTRGHLFTKTNPVRTRRQYKPDLNITHFKLSEDDLETVFQAGEEIGIGPAKLKDIIDHLQKTYCKSIGAEYMFIRQPERVEWLQQRMEPNHNEPNFDIEKKKRILKILNRAVVFENFLHTRYAGQKRFSLQGGETLIPGLEAVIEKGSELGIEEIMIGMPHRGRLNVLVNILDKSYEEVFSEFEGKEYADSVFSGDVKYHLGYTSECETHHGKSMKIGLAPNPSHLEAVDPVVEGMVRSKIDFSYNGNPKKILPVLIHGDAAIAAQGVVFEVIQMSLLDGYGTGGTIHLVVNNQLGFTTNYLDGRSSTYCTDVAKVTRSPVFHVNADDSEAVVQAVELAVAYRQEFHTDVFIDLLGYRKYGHNEGDEPRFTQPRLYKAIARHPDPREIYMEKLHAGDNVEKGLAKEMEKEYRKLLKDKLETVKEDDFKAANQSYRDHCDLKQRSEEQQLYPVPDTAVNKKNLDAIAGKIFSTPSEFKPIKKMKNIYDHRMKKYKEGRELDWAIAEMLAYGSLLIEGVPVRLTGQDTVRGTFSHRHAQIMAEDDETTYLPLNQLSDDQARFQIYNSLLSEYAALGFEYGYACANPDGLTIWEAQFGDFNNAAQIIIDQFISSSEQKWNRSNGITLFLPHGYEGQGPEHSSARIERFLMLCANENMRLANCTTPANFFHLLRSQVKYDFRLPLVVFTPKSLLRHAQCVSPLSEFSEGQFKDVLDDDYAKADKVKKVLLCSGKVYYDLLKKQQEDERRDVAIIRLEQLYPLPVDSLKKIIERYSGKKQLIWVQEEPQNSGVLMFMHYHLRDWNPDFISRKASPVPATGFHKVHEEEQEEIIEKAFA